jgi:hypothetical protein
MQIDMSRIQVATHSRRNLLDHDQIAIFYVNSDLKEVPEKMTSISILTAPSRTNTADHINTKHFLECCFPNIIIAGDGIPFSTDEGGSCESVWIEVGEYMG